MTSGSSSDKPLIAVDWGTSSLRGARIDASGRVQEERSFPRGILTVSAGGFPAVFNECFGDWMRNDKTLCLVSGMAGSRQGWTEAPYCPCPAGFSELASHLHWIEPGRIALVPGLSHIHDDVPHASPPQGTPDVMRGEEVQIFGAMQLTELRDGLFVLPGTHSKWARVVDGRVDAFRTFMTGEFYALLNEHSILSRTIDTKAPFTQDAFLRGVGHSQNGAGLLHNAFSARTLSLFSRLEAGPLASYLSGLVIGEELCNQDIQTGTEVVLVGSEALTARYAAAMQLLGIHSRVPQANATWAGLHALRLALQN